MTIAFSTPIRAARLNAITAEVGSLAFMRIYSGSRPTSGGTATTLLAELVCNATFAATTSGATLTLNAITAEDAALANGTASWGRVVKSDGTTFCFDFTIAASAGVGVDMVMANTSIVVSQPVTVTSFVFTEGNA